MTPTTAPAPRPTAPLPTGAADAGAPVAVPLLRRAALSGAALLAGALPLVWGSACALQLLGGTQTDHRFHQLTGQGLLLAALWLGAVVPLVRAGLRGRRPSTTAGLHALGFCAATVAAAALAQEAGAGPVAAITVVTLGLVWAALPLRPQVRHAFGGLDPALTPLALLLAALVTPFALGQAEQQHAMADEHAEMAHYFDMAWVTLGLLAMALVAAGAPVARRLALLAFAGTAWVGAAGALFTDDVTWSVLAMALGTAGAVVAAVRPAPGGPSGTAA